MTIEEAIGRLENRRELLFGKSFEKDRQAITLGIEALHAALRKEIRIDLPAEPIGPGETKE